MSESNKNLHDEPVINGLAGIPRQIGVMLGLALSVAIGVAIVLWSQDPSYGRLYSEVSESDAGQILEILKKENIKYKVESGAIMVPMDQVSVVKLKLSAQGLPKKSNTGYDLLDKDQGFGTSKSVETVRFQRALEGEIAQTIMSIQNVKTARVLLAIPVQSVFVRERKKPSASVMVNLGRSLDKGQVESIIHLVSSSVPMLEAGQVTVVDQKGQLLNSTSDNLKQFEYKKQIEDHLMGRIEKILSPLVSGMSAQISADVDFTETDRTQEMFNPDLLALRSEQTSEDKNSAQGAPGALQPDAQGSKNATRNYELDKTITHTKLATGALQRLSVAVVVDDKHILQADGSTKNQAYSPEDINRFLDLVRQAIGFDSSRGDQVTVNNVAFKPNDIVEALPEIPLWENPWFIDIMKQIAAVLAVLFLLFGILRPTMRSLIGKEKLLDLPENKQNLLDGIKHGSPEAVHQQNTPLVVGREDLLLIDVPQSYEHRLEYVKRLVDDDSKIVAQVIKSWIKRE